MRGDTLICGSGLGAPLCRRHSRGRYACFAACNFSACAEKLKTVMINAPQLPPSLQSFLYLVVIIDLIQKIFFQRPLWDRFPLLEDVFGVFLGGKGGLASIVSKTPIAALLLLGNHSSDLSVVRAHNRQ